jgi:drug/metabolite transporter (DMT)-like permease
MLDTIFGLPMHPLIVHATVVIVPTAALLVALAAVYPRFRTWIGPVPALAAVLGCVLVPLSTGSGEELEHRVGDTSLVEKHADLAETLIWFVLPLAAVAVIGYWLHRRRSVGKRLVAAVAVVAVGVAAATLIDVALIGHSGAKASWSNIQN